MYFLEKLCRICIQTGAPLVDIQTVDFDLVRLSEKLEICANLKISRDSVSSEICEKCVNKLRVSYHFLNMCRKSTNIIQGYVDKLNNTLKTEVISEDVSKESYIPCQKGELNVEIEQLSEVYNYYEQQICHVEEVEVEKSSVKGYCHKRKQRITKGQRCSLLQQLLNRPKKERDKLRFSTYHTSYDEYTKGGLKNIIDFTKNYEFAFNLDKNSNIETTPLDKLMAFSRNYFSRDFSEFKKHVLCIIESQNDYDCESAFGSEEEVFSSDNEWEGSEGEQEQLSFEEVEIKKELDNGEDEDSHCPLDYLETSFEEVEEEEEALVKKECVNFGSDLEADQPALDVNLNSQVKQEPYEEELTCATPISDFKRTLDSSPAVKLLDRLVASYPMNSRKVFSASNVRCRTRDHPYINPVLKNQFLYRSFKCERCNRYFKSQGYLKAHTSKVH